ncbi:MAG: hypothetical protein IJJ67_03420 [Oscillospiraceae bacterium]|nr:hypothetical protein [Oscillospiraceae bacterium]
MKKTADIIDFSKEQQRLNDKRRGHEELEALAKTLKLKGGDFEHLEIRQGKDGLVIYKVTMKKLYPHTAA